MRANRRLIAPISGRSSVGTSAGACADTGSRSSASRASSSCDNACTGRRARRTPAAMTASRTGSISSHGSSWLNSRSRSTSARSSEQLADCHGDSRGGLQVEHAPLLARERQLVEARAPCLVGQGGSFAIDQQRLASRIPYGHRHVGQIRTAAIAVWHRHHAAALRQLVRQPGRQQRHDLLREPHLLRVEELVDLHARAPGAEADGDQPDRGRADQQEQQQAALQRHAGVARSGSPSA